jgi:dihydrouridine synthase, duS
LVEENFAKEIQGERNILAKYKEFWSYFAKSYKGGEKGLKEIRKAKNLAEYKAAKYRFFAESHFQAREGLGLCF